MTEPPTHRERLTRLVDGPSTNGEAASRSLPSQALRAIALRATRPLARHQQRVDRAIIAWSEDREAVHAAEIAQLRGELQSLRAWLQATSDRGDELNGAVGWLREEARLDQASRAELARLRRLIAVDSALASEPLELEAFTDELGNEVVGFRGARSGDGVYPEFEDVFRGSEDLIRERQRSYLPLLLDRAPVLDIGCGRGELLELLRDGGIAARGVDLDEAMVDRCVAKGLSVRRQDAVSALEDIEPSSLGGVVAAQVIEHLPYDDLVATLRGAAAVLRQGGILILETVNPHAPQALKQFWIDPTHQHPLFPEVVLALLRSVGFTEGYIWHPGGNGDPEGDRGEQPDYTIVATSRA